MGGEGGQRKGRIFGGIPKTARVVFFEETQAAPEDFLAAHGLAHAFRDRSQIFPHHQAPVPAAFQRHDSDQVVERIVNIGSFPGRGPLGDPIEAHEPHDVIQAQGPRHLHVGSQDLDERFISTFFLSAWGQKGTTPHSWPLTLKSSGGAPTRTRRL